MNHINALTRRAVTRIFPVRSRRVQNSLGIKMGSKSTLYAQATIMRAE
jgi:hypothetical protein